jgi:D-methionine transport system substrate-binding protein
MDHRPSRTLTAVLAVAALALSACGTDDAGDDATDTTPDDAPDAATDEDAAATDDDLDVLRVGVSPVPHGDILAFVRDELAADAGLEIEIVEFTDYVQPNVALHEGDLDANYFQHLPYLTQQLDDNPDYALTPLSGVHVEPLALYSDTLSDLEKLPEGAQIAVPNDPANLGRSLWLLEEHGVLRVADTGDELPTEQDVEDNPLELTFRPVEAASLPSVLADVEAAVINGNYALEAGLSPAEDGLAVESSDDNPYANLLTVRDGDEDDPLVTTLDDLLTSDEVRSYIEETFTDGTVVPAT